MSLRPDDVLTTGAADPLTSDQMERYMEDFGEGLSEDWLQAKQEAAQQAPGAGLGLHNKG